MAHSAKASAIVVPGQNRMIHEPRAIVVASAQIVPRERPTITSFPADIDAIIPPTSMATRKRHESQVTNHGFQILTTHQSRLS